MRGECENCADQKNMNYADQNDKHYADQNDKHFADQHTNQRELKTTISKTEKKNMQNCHFRP